MSMPLFAQELRHVKGLQFAELAAGSHHLQASYGRYLKRDLYVKAGIRYENYPLHGMRDSLVSIIEGDSLFMPVGTLSRFRSYNLHGSISYSLLSLQEQLFVNAQVGLRAGLEQEQAPEAKEYLIFGCWLGSEAEWFIHSRVAFSAALRQHLIMNTQAFSRRTFQLGIKINI